MISKKQAISSVTVARPSSNVVLMHAAYPSQGPSRLPVATFACLASVAATPYLGGRVLYGREVIGLCLGNKGIKHV